MIHKALIFILFFANAAFASGHENPTGFFNINFSNNSSHPVYYRFLDQVDTLNSNEHINIRKIINHNVDLPFYFSIFIKLSTGANGFKSMNFRILSDTLHERTLIVSADNEITFLSDPSEMKVSNFFAHQSGAFDYKTIKSFILENRTNLAGTEVLFLELCRNKYTVDSIRLIYNLLSSLMKESRSGVKIKNYLSGRKFLKIGQVVSNFSLKDTSNLTKNIFDCNSKYLLLDFWFSSCIPCIAGFPDLKFVYKNYHRDIFQIASISVDPLTNLDKWKKAIKSNNLPWLNFVDPTYSISYKMFSIESYPTTILINVKTRQIIAINPDSKKLEKLIERH